MRKWHASDYILSFSQTERTAFCAKFHVCICSLVMRRITKVKVLKWISTLVFSKGQHSVLPASKLFLFCFFSEYVHLSLALWPGLLVRLMFCLFLLL